MSIVIDETLVGMWYILFATGNDWLGAVSRCGDGTYELNYRHRYYRDDLTTSDSQDVKHWYTVKTEGGNDEQVITWVRTTTQTLAEALGTEVTEILVHDGDVEAFLRELTAQPFAHAQEISDE